MPSGFGLNAFTQGAMQGANFVAGLQGAQELRRERQARDAREQQQFELNQKLVDYKLQGLQKARGDEDALRKLTAAQYALTAGQDPAVAHALMANPAFRQMARDGLEIAAHQVIGEGGPPGAKKSLNKLVPLPNGKIAVDLNVTRADGTTYTAPVTEGRTDDPNEPVAQFTPQQLIQGISNQKAAIAMIQAARIAHGDTTPIATAQKAKELQAKHDFEIKKMIAQSKIDQTEAAGKLQNEKALEAYKAGLKPEKPVYKQGTDGTLYAVQGTRATQVMAGGHGLQVPADSGKNSIPATVQTIEWMAANLTNGDKQAAYRLYNQGKSDPRALAASIYSKLVKENETRFGNDKRTPDQLWDATQATIRRIYSDPLLNPLARGSAPQAAAAAPPAPAPEALPAPAQGVATAAQPAGGLTPTGGAEAANVPPVSELKEGVRTTFANGQTWMLVDGRPVRVR